MAARGECRVTTAGRLCHEVLAAATHQRAGFRSIAQRGECDEEGGIAGTAAPAGEEQLHRVDGEQHADHADGEQCNEQHLGVAALAA